MKGVAHTKPLTLQQKAARDKKLIEDRKRLTGYYFAVKEGLIEAPVSIKRVYQSIFGGSRQRGSKYFVSRIKWHNA